MTPSGGRPASGRHTPANREGIPRVARDPRCSRHPPVTRRGRGLSHDRPSAEPEVAPSAQYPVVGMAAPRKELGSHGHPGRPDEPATPVCPVCPGEPVNLILARARLPIFASTLCCTAATGVQQSSWGARTSSMDEYSARQVSRHCNRQHLHLTATGDATLSSRQGQSAATPVQQVCNR